MRRYNMHSYDGPGGTPQIISTLPRVTRTQGDDAPCPGIVTARESRAPFRNFSRSSSCVARRTKRTREFASGIARLIETYALLLAVALILCVGSLGSPAAWAQNPGYATCIEDGGSAKCKPPTQSDPYFRQYSDAFISGGPYPSQDSLHGAIAGESYCAHTVQQPPWTFTYETGSVPGIASWTATVSHDITARNCDPGILGPGETNSATEQVFVRQFVTLSCPYPYQPSPTHTANYPLGYCQIPAVQSCQKSQCPQSVGDPIDVISGNLTQHEVDYSGGGQTVLKFARTYNYIGGDTGPDSLNGAVGQGWTHTYERRLGLHANGAIRAARPDGEDRVFVPASGGYQEFGTSVDRLTTSTDGAGNFTGWIFVDEDDNAEAYDAGGFLQNITYRGGQIVALTYSTTATPASIAPVPGLLITVADAFGHQISFTYTAQALIATMTDPNGAVYMYTNSSGLLTSVGYPDSTTRQFLYNEGAYNGGINLPYALTGIIDENGSRYATFGYDSSGYAVSSQHAGGVELTTLLGRYYSAYQGYGYTYVNDALGTQRYYTYTSAAGVAKYSGIYTPCYTCADAAYRVGYDTHGNVNFKEDFNGNLNISSFDLTRNLETSRTEGSGSAQARTITTQWNASWREPALITESNRTTSFTYDDNGNLLAKTIADTTVSPNIVRTWTYTYDSYGRTLTSDGPRTDVSDVTTYSYYTCTTGSQCGQVQTATNAAGLVTTFNTYNAYGQPLVITDPNGVATTMTYDSRQRVTSRQVNNEVTTFAYWPTGLLKQVTLADASYLQYTYDAAHRLTQISDSLGNAVNYTLDAMGNRTAENTYDPANTLHRAHSQVINSLNQLYKDVNAAGTAAVTTTFGYDGYGHQISIAAPLSRTTASTYDALNRLNQITDPANGVTRFGYDANDNLTTVTDPRMLTTSYGYNGFGDLVSQSSPDTGGTTNTLDSAGNLATSTDSRGAVATYAYDALNRVTSVAYSLGGSTDQTITLAYDAGANGKGHLTGASDANHAMSWTDDALGRVATKSQTVGGVTLPVSYAYSNADLTTLTTTSGQTVTYGYNTNHQITSVAVNGTTVLNNATYEPFGPINGWTWGNGTTTTRTYDADGKIATINGAGTKTFSYDDAFRITGITDTSTGAANWTYDYDTLDRITSGVSPSTTTRGWSYDANGNRLSESGSAASTYAVSPTNNRITAITGALARTYGYDAAGNTTSYATVTATYNDAGRLATLTNGSTTESSVYNALGQRVRVNGGATGTVLYAYDEAGHLLGEYDGSGNLIEETAWLGDIPVATLRPNGSSVSIYYVHTDQLNTPRAVTRPADNLLMWTWNSDPFGTDAANENPADAGTFVYNLRLPGQIFDGEAGLHQNYFRDFDPAVGRYVESDPIGLAGRSYSTYAYVGGNPIWSVDPEGLYECTYSISAHSMSCVPNVIPHPPFGSTSYVSGNNGSPKPVPCNCQNNPAANPFSDHGPLPVGDYTIGLQDARQRRRLTPDAGNLMFNRRNFEIHGCANPAECSEGCIGATTNRTRDLLNQLLHLEEGSNRLHVIL